MALRRGRPVGESRNILIGSVIPAGTIAPFAGPVVPDGWLLCDGSLIDRTTYSALFNVIGTAHGYGDQTTTFNLPDYRGRFLRGHANGSANDPDRATRTAMATGGAVGDNVGSVQGDENKTHTHIQNAHKHDTALVTGDPAQPPMVFGTGGYHRGAGGGTLMQHLIPTLPIGQPPPTKTQAAQNHAP